MEATLHYGEHRIPYQLHRSPRRRTVGLRIDPEQGLVVRMPARLPRNLLEEVLRRKAAWVLRHLRAAEAARALRPARRWDDGAPLPFRGGRLTLRLVEGGPAAALAGDTLRVRRPEPGADPGEAVRARVVAWYRAQAQAACEAAVAAWQGRLGVSPERVRAKEQRRRWGSCTPRGALYFNWRLVLAPPDVLDYVVVHELCHLRVLNHSPAFWALVADLLPGHARQRAWLKHHGGELFF